MNEKIKEPKTFIFFLRAKAIYKKIIKKLNEWSGL